MLELLNDLVFQTAAVPLAAGVAAVGGLRALGGAALGPRLAAAGVAVAFLAAFALIVGVPALPPPSSMGKLFWSAAAGLALGLLGDAAGVRGRSASALVAVWLAGSVVWLALPALSGPLDVAVLAGLLAAGALVAFAPLSDDRAAAPAAGVLGLALAVGGVAFVGSSASAAQVGFALAAAAGGFLLWNWPVERHLWGVSGRVAAGLPVLLAAVLAFFTQAPAAVLPLALPALLVPWLRRRLPLADTPAGRALGTVAAAAAAVLAAALAVGLAFLVAGGEASPY